MRRVMWIAMVLGLVVGWSGVVAAQSMCGNGRINKNRGEQCDGAKLGGQSCESLGFHGGTLVCSATCQFDTSECIRFVDNLDGTLTDSLTGLMWEIKSNDGSVHDVDNTYTWNTGGTVIPEPGEGTPNGTVFTDFLDVLNNCVSNDGGRTVRGGFAGYCDWRLSTPAELRTILQAQFPDCASSPCVDPAFNTGCTAGCTVTSCSCTAPSFHWSSVSSADEPFGYANWSANFGEGSVSLVPKGFAYYARAVRGGQ